MRIVIIGGSIGGLAAAIALRRAGADVVVCERRQNMEDQGASLALRPEAVAALTKLGVAIAGAPIGGWRYAAEVDGAVETRLEWGAPVTAYTYSALRDALLRQATGIEIRTGAAVTEIGASSVRVAGEEIAADLVVAADGVDSIARGADGADPEARPAYTGIVMFRGFAREKELERAFPREVLEKLFDVNTQIFARGAAGWWLGLLIPERSSGAGRQFGWVCYLREDERALDELMTDADGIPRYWGTSPGKTSELAKARMRDKLATHFPEPIASLAHLGLVSVHKVAKFVAPRMVMGRVCLVGDAAHVVPPFTTAGATLAIADAVALAERLGDSCGSARLDTHATAALEAWNDERRAAVQQVFRQADAIVAHTIDHPPDLVRALPDELTSWARGFIPPGTDRFLRPVRERLWATSQGGAR